MGVKIGSERHAGDGDAHTAVPRERKPSARGRIAAERILGIARRAFAERGYRGASLNEIAKGSGLTMAGLLHHYPSKKELFAAVLHAQEEEDDALFRSFVPEDAGLFEMLTAFAKMARINVERYRFVQFSHMIAAESAGGDHPATEESREHYRRARGLVEAACRRSIARGEVNDDLDPQTVAHHVVAMVEGLQNQWLHEPSVDYADLFEAWATQFRRSLLAERPV